MFGNLLKVVTKVAVGLPLAIAADVVTLGGTLNNKVGTHTGDMIDGISETIEDIAEE